MTHASWPADWGRQQAALYAWVDAALPEAWTVIWAAGQGPGQQREGPIPSPPFATLRLLVAPEPSSLPHEDASGLVRVPGRMTVEVQTFSRQAHTHELEGLRLGLTSRLTRQALRGVGLVPLGSRMHDLSTISGTRREHRVGLDVDFGVELAHQAPSPGVFSDFERPSFALESA